MVPPFTCCPLSLSILKKSKKPVKLIIMDQEKLAGVGNIYADEALWRAKIHPETRIENLSESDFVKLHESIRFVMNKSIEKGGSTDRNYVNADGSRGNYLEYAAVYQIFEF